jgi:hypothetical protein
MPALQSWTLFAVDHDTDDNTHSLTEFVQLAGGVLFRETYTSRGGVSIALTWAPGLELEADTLEPDGLRLARP